MLFMKDRKLPTKSQAHEAKDDFCTTREASVLLGLSLGKVQQMAESGELKAWKTSGGHRRVSLRSVEENLRKRGTEIVQNEPCGDLLGLLIAEDNLDLQRLYLKTISGWGMPMVIQVVGNGFDGLIKIGVHAPDVLIVDLLMPGIDGFEMIKRLHDNPDLNDMDIIVVTGIGSDEIAERGGLPAAVTVYQKPIPFAELRGYLQARVAQRLRATSGP
jgi:excisionase family DNA binding protein